jgi:predicted NACHT family NTPase
MMYVKTCADILISIVCLLLGQSISCEDRKVSLFQNAGELLPDYRASYLKRFIKTHLSNRDWKYSVFKKLIYAFIN